MFYGVTPFILAKQNNDKELMDLMDKYKPLSAESPLGGCTFLGLCMPDSSNSNLQSVQTGDDPNLFEL